MSQAAGALSVSPNEEVLAEIAAAPLPNSYLKTWDHGWTLIIDGLQLTTAYDREAIANKQIYMIKQHEPEPWVYGVGLGDVPRALLKREEVKVLHAVIMNRGIARLSLATDQQGDWIDDPRVVLHLARDVDQVYGPFAVSPTELRLCDADAQPLRDCVQSLINEPFHAAVANRRAAVELEQINTNSAFLLTDPKVDKLFKTRPQSQAIVVAGGPTINQSYEWIKAQRYGYVIAASTSLKPLLAHGIMPEYVVMADCSPSLLSHIDGDPVFIQCRNMRLVYMPSVYPAILRAWPGTRYWATVAEGDGDMFCGGSVVHVAADLAVKIGAREVTLVGADFCYPNNESHVSGAPQPYDIEGTWRPMVTNGLGESVQTDDALTKYRINMERYVSWHPEVSWQKLGRAGCAIGGMTWVDQ